MLILFLLIHLIPNCFNQTLIQASISHNGDKNVTFQQGEIFQAIIKIKPIRKEDFHNFKKIEGELIADSIYVSEINKINYKKHTVMITATAIFQKYLDHEIVHIWDFKKKKIHLKLKNLSITQQNNRHKEYAFYEQEGNLDITSYAYIILVIILLLSILLFILKRLIVHNKEKKNKLKRKRIYLKWKEQFSKAKSRTDYEKIYLNKNEWMQFSENNKVLVKGFLNSINSCQYKREWGNEELNKIVSSFNKIRRILNE